MLYTGESITIHYTTWPWLYNNNNDNNELEAVDVWSTSQAQYYWPVNRSRETEVISGRVMARWGAVRGMLVVLPQISPAGLSWPPCPSFVGEPRMGGSMGGAENSWGINGGVRRPDWRKGELVGVRRPAGIAVGLPAVQIHLLTSNPHIEEDRHKHIHTYKHKHSMTYIEHLNYYKHKTVSELGIM